jgi:hypothetical protein
MSKITFHPPAIVHVLAYYPPHLGDTEDVAFPIAWGL